ncbi:hypothetical protein ABTL70_19685, partial [Acinetobacter baumannii]
DAERRAAADRGVPHAGADVDCADQQHADERDDTGRHPAEQPHQHAGQQDHTADRRGAEPADAGAVGPRRRANPGQHRLDLQQRQAANRG